MSAEFFDDLYAQHAHRVRRIVSAILRAPHDVDDVVQDVFVQAWRQIDRFDPARGNVHAWIGIIARSRAIDRLRSAARLEYRPEWDSQPSMDADAVEGLLEAEREASMDQSLIRLTREQRLLMRLAFHEGLSHSRIAASLGRPLGTVKSQIRSTLRALRDQTAHAAAAPFRARRRRDHLPFTVVEAAPAHDLRSLTIVAIDDEPEALAMIGAVLKLFGAEASLHESVDAGVGRVAERWPDLVIADLDMPGEDGYACLSRLRVLASERRQSLPVLAFTGCVSEQERSRVTLAGFDAYLTKPLHPIALCEAARRLTRPSAA